MTEIQRKFATFERFDGAQWKPAEFESFKPGEYMKTSNSPGKVVLIQGIPSPIVGDPGNWGVHGRTLTEDEQREAGIIE